MDDCPDTSVTENVCTTDGERQQWGGGGSRRRKEGMRLTEKEKGKVTHLNPPPHPHSVVLSGCRP